MKKKREVLHPYADEMRLNFRKMKLTTILLFIVCVTFGNSFSQVRLSVHFDKSDIREVLLTIEEKTDYVFLYKDQIFDFSQKISAAFNEAKFEDVLKDFCDQTNISYEIRNRQIILKSKEPDGLPTAQQPQKRTVTGRVTDTAGDPIPGVSVIVNGTSVGTITDSEGNFSLQVPGDVKALTFSFVGMKTLEVPAAGKTTFFIEMDEETVGVDEVVVIGYGIQKKVNLSGAVDVVTSEALVNRPVNNVVQALQGMAPNLNVTVGNEGGELGGKMSMNIRGIGSISGSGGNPYILVDGIEQSIYNINPEDVESISVLKDAAASAIYGARAAFGVILITTKRGQTDGVTVNYSNSFSFATPINRPKSVNSIKFAEYFNLASANDGNVPIFEPIIIENMHKYQAGELTDWTMPIPWEPNYWLTYQGGWANTDWYKVYYKDWVPKSTHGISLSGGDQRTQFFVSGSTFDQDGLLRYGDDTYIRNNLNAKINTSVNDWLRFSFLSKFNRTNLNRPSYDKDAMYANIARSWPTNDVFFPDGNRHYETGLIYVQQGDRYIENSNEFTVIPGIEIEPVKGWVINANYRWKMNTNGYTNHEAKVQGTFTDGSPFYLRPNNYFARNQYESYYNSPNVYSTYHKKIGSHQFTALAGFEQEKVDYQSSYSRKDDLISDEKPSLGTATGKEYASGTLGHWATRSYFGRLNYDFREKYLLEVSARRDGSSKFEKGYRWGLFPSGSMAYIISKESFWEPLETYIPMMKVRGSFGSLGNQDVANYLYVERLPVYTNLPYIMGDDRPNYIGMAGLSSPELTWERVNTTNFGLDVGLVKNKLTASIDYFIRDTYDMLGPVESLPAVLGTEVPRSNNATLKTNGFELIVGWKDKIKDFSYDAKFMLSDAKTKIMEYYNPQDLLSAPFYEGMQMGEIWGYTTTGLFQTDQEAQSKDQSYLSKEVWRAGDVQYADLNGDEKINIGKNTVGDHGDLSIIGNSTPRYSYSFLLNVSWKGFDYNMIWQGVGKRDLWLDSPNFWGAGWIWTAVAFEEHMDYWTEDNRDAYFPRPYMDKGGKNHQVQTRFLQNGAYLRLKSLQLGYTLPENLTRKCRVKKLRFFVTGENLLTFTKLPKNFDPESTGGAHGAGMIYPLQINLATGVNITF